VPQQLLHGADVVAVFEQMRGEGVTQGVAVARFAIPARRSRKVSAARNHFPTHLLP
jgi:hypothetical protein